MISVFPKAILSFFATFSVALVAFAGVTGAYQVTFDQFTIYKNGFVYVNDTFGDGDPPPASGSNFGTSPFPATYFTFGDWQESGGRAIADSANNPAVGESPFNPGTFNARHSARINSNTQPLTSSTNGLKSDDAFEVYVSVDLSSVLDKNSSGYSLRLRDSTLGHTINDEASIGVRRTSTGDFILRFADQDNSTGSSTTLDTDAFSPSLSDDQIVLALTRAAPSGGDTNPGVIGSYAYVDGSIDLTDTIALGALTFTQMDGSVTLFGDEDWTRADIAVFEQQVPEPESLALFAVGLASVGLLRRRRRS